MSDLDRQLREVDPAVVLPTPGAAPMQRPTMNSASSSVKPPRRDPPQRGRRGIFSRFLHLMASDPMRYGRPSLRVEGGSIVWKITRAILYRLALVPVAAILLAAGLVYFRTHPTQPTVTADPFSKGVYFEHVTMITDDHVSLQGWLAPALDASQVNAEHEEILKKRWPAAVLVHGFGTSAQQMLPLFAPLHQRGWIVLALNLRGGGSLSASGQTFGLNESLDVKAALQWLRRSSIVDTTHIAVVGIGSGANAALLAAERDPQLAALVLDAPIENGDQAFASHIYSIWPPLKALDPLCELAFQLGYGLNMHDLDMDHYGSVMAARPTMLTRWSPEAEKNLSEPGVTQIADFLNGTIEKPQAADNEP
jgi:pimeloyl-ACP methyl ester carboxylesterase